MQKNYRMALLLFIILTVLYSSLFFVGDILPNAMIVGIILLLASITSLGLYFYTSKKIVLFSLILSIGIQISFIFLPDAHNDIYRYLWDGYATSQDENVYEVTPWDTYEKNFPDGGSQEIKNLWEKTGFKNYYTTYPPTMQISLWISAKILPLNPIGIKLFFLLLNIGSTILLWKIFHQNWGQKSLQNNIQKLEKFFPIIILSPLFLWETVAAGHSESIFIFFLLLSIFLYGKKFFFWCGVSLSALIWTKFFPVILVPIFLMGLYREHSFKNFIFFSLGGISSTLVLWYKFLPFDPTKFFEALKLYSDTWNMFPLFFGFFEEIFSRQIASFFQLLAVIITLLFTQYKKFSIPESIALVLTVFLLFASTIFSWYFLWAFFLLPFLLIRKKFFFLWSFLLIPFLQYFFTHFEAEEYLFWYINNGLGDTQRIIFWSPLAVFFIIQIIKNSLKASTLKLPSKT